jgi:hypothetical protein
MRTDSHYHQMFYPDFHTNRSFRDFNFCARWDPSLKGGPSSESLVRLVYEARQGDRSAAGEFGSAMYYTLRPAAFEAFQKRRGPYGITYTEWFYSKLKQYFEILLYLWLDVTEMAEDGNLRVRVVEQPWEEGLDGFLLHGDLVEDEEIEQALIPEDNERVGWGALVYEVSRATANRTEVLRAWLDGERSAKVANRRPLSSWEKNRERDEIILDCLKRGMSRADVCRQLDKRTIPTLPALQKMGFQRWTDAWGDPDGRQAIQRLFSKKSHA